MQFIRLIYVFYSIFFKDSTSEEENNLKIVNRKQIQKDTQVKKTYQHDRQTLHLDKNTGDISLTRDSVSLSYESSSQEKSVDEIQVKITQRGPNRAFLPEKPSQITQVLPPKPQIPTKPTCSFIKPVIKGKLKPLKSNYLIEEFSAMCLSTKLQFSSRKRITLRIS